MVTRKSIGYLFAFLVPTIISCSSPAVPVDIAKKHETFMSSYKIVQQGAQDILDKANAMTPSLASFASINACKEACQKQQQTLSTVQSDFITLKNTGYCKKEWREDIETTIASQKIMLDITLALVIDLENRKQALVIMAAALLPSQNN